MTETLSPTLPDDVESLVTEVLKAAADQSLKLVTAESCTGGLLASLLTDVDGRAHVFERGFVTYAEEAKVELIDVPAELIERHTAVSPQVAEAMAKGALAKSKGDIAVAITGYAGRGGPDDEPGLVFFGVARHGREVRVDERHFGDVGRGEVRLACLRHALEMLNDAVSQAPARGPESIR
jgi:nicotinamide-nucleotide amidase